LSWRTIGGRERLVWVSGVDLPVAAGELVGFAVGAAWGEGGCRDGCAQGDDGCEEGGGVHGGGCKGGFLEV
jgi:hypothetical protein